MAKSKGSFGRFLAFATIAGAVAAGISYFTKYKSFHKELEEDFHDFEDDDDDYPIDSTMSRNYVPISSEKSEAAEAVSRPDSAADPSGPADHTQSKTDESSGEADGTSDQKVSGETIEISDSAIIGEADMSSDITAVGEADTSSADAADGEADTSSADAADGETDKSSADAADGEADKSSDITAAAGMDTNFDDIAVSETEEEDYSFLDLDENESSHGNFEPAGQDEPESDASEDHIKKIDPQPDEPVNTIIVEEFQ